MILEYKLLNNQCKLLNIEYRLPNNSYNVGSKVNILPSIFQTKPREQTGLEKAYNDTNSCRITKKIRQKKAVLRK